jgi:hypothetical protein
LHPTGRFHPQFVDLVRQERLDPRVLAAWEADDIAVYGHLALEYGHRLMALNLEWTEWAIGQLDARQARAAEA